MKVVILGPVISNVSSGGVAVFDEGLYRGFAENGNEVFMISNQPSTNIETIVISKKPLKPSHIIFKKEKIARIIKKIKPDLVIASLHYAMGIKQYKRKWNKATYVQVLHGFPCPINGRFKANLINHLIRKSYKHFDKVVAVSSLTYALNKKINRIVCTNIIPNGCDISTETSTSNKRDYDFVYVGRLFKDKEVKMIAESFIQAKRINPLLRFAIAGYGEMEKLFLEGEFKCEEIDFLGKLSQNEVSSLLSRSKFLVSMNSLEPFGIVFAEAIINGCNIVTQSTSGFAGFAIKEKYYHICDSISSEDLANNLCKFATEFEPINKKEIDRLRDLLSFSSVAKEYEKLAAKKEDD